MKSLEGKERAPSHSSLVGTPFSSTFSWLPPLWHLGRFFFSSSFFSLACQANPLPPSSTRRLSGRKTERARERAGVIRPSWRGVKNIMQEGATFWKRRSPVEAFSACAIPSLTLSSALRPHPDLDVTFCTSPVCAFHTRRLVCLSVPVRKEKGRVFSSSSTTSSCSSPSLVGQTVVVTTSSHDALAMCAPPSLRCTDEGMTKGHGGQRNCSAHSLGPEAHDSILRLVKVGLFISKDQHISLLCRHLHDFSGPFSPTPLLYLYAILFPAPWQMGKLSLVGFCFFLKGFNSPLYTLDLTLWQTLSVSSAWKRGACVPSVDGHGPLSHASAACTHANTHARTPLHRYTCSHAYTLERAPRSCYCFFSFCTTERITDYGSWQTSKQNTTA